jgi:hypothetical protein
MRLHKVYMQSDGACMIVVVFAFVTCSGETRGSAILRQILPGLQVVMQALTTTNVNILIDLVQDNCPEPLAHIIMLLMWRSVDSTLIYRSCRYLSLS